MSHPPLIAAQRRASDVKKRSSRVIRKTQSLAKRRAQPLETVGYAFPTGGRMFLEGPLGVNPLATRRHCEVLPRCVLGEAVIGPRQVSLFRGGVEGVGIGVMELHFLPPSCIGEDQEPLPSRQCPSASLISSAQLCLIASVQPPRRPADSDATHGKGAADGLKKTETDEKIKRLPAQDSYEKRGPLVSQLSHPLQLMHSTLHAPV